MSLPEINELSEREQDILRLVATGAGNKQIAAQLFISTNTVKVHLRNIFVKIGVNSRTEAAMVAIRLGLVQSSAAEAINGTILSNESHAAVEVSSHIHTTTLLEPELSEGDVKPEFPLLPDEPRSEFTPRRLNRLQVWGLSAGLLVLVVVLVILGIRQVGPRPASPRITTSPAPRITPLPRWQARSSMPAARMNLAVVAYNDQIYAIGGETAGGVTGVMERYDPAVNSWEALPAKPLPVTDVQAVVVGGKIYVPGGRTIAGTVTNHLDIYDPSTDQWEQGADLPAALSAYAIVAFEGRLYLFGGWDGSQFTDRTYVYDPRLNSWSALTSMSARRGLAGAAVAGGKIYVVGGKDDQAALAVVDVYFPDREGRENPWRTVASMPSGRYGMGISSLADILYVVCGHGTDDTAQPSLAYIPQTDTWQSFELPPADLGSGLGLALSGEYLYAVGGRIGTKPMADLLAYQVVYTVGIPVIIK